MLYKNSILASLLISLGVIGLIVSNYSYFSMILFSFGLFTICALNLNLFTGICGFVIQRGNYIELLIILIINLLSGYLIGCAYSYINPEYITSASTIMTNWSISLSYFLKSVGCGIIMFLAVYLVKDATKTNIGIFLGVPLFILCGFQHSIANVIIMGIARSFDPALFLCILGNFIGSIITWYLNYDDTYENLLAAI